MPSLCIGTNLKKEDIPKDFAAEAADFISSLLGKPKGCVMVQVSPDQVMSFGGTSEPCANIQLLSIGAVGPDKNREIAPELCKFLEEKLNIKKNRFYINIFDIPAHAWIVDGTPFGV